MRIYTSRRVEALFSYVKLAAAVGLFVVFMGFASKVWENDPNVREIKELIQAAPSNQ